jgi:predicted Zn-ribbon and HTH transcriptional regulator
MKQLIKCPVCHSSNVRDDSQYGHNGIFGHGSRSWLIFEIFSCNDCGIYFRPKTLQAKECHDSKSDCHVDNLVSEFFKTKDR